MAGTPKNMVWIPGGEFLMGSEQFYPEEGPVRTVSVETIDTTTSHIGFRCIVAG